MEKEHSSSSQEGSRHLQVVPAVLGEVVDLTARREDKERPVQSPAAYPSTDPLAQARDAMRTASTLGESFYARGNYGDAKARLADRPTQTGDPELESTDANATVIPFPSRANPPDDAS